MTVPVHKSPTSRAVALGLLIVQVLVAGAAGYWVLMQTLLIAGCGDECAYDAVAGAWRAQLWVSLGSVVLSSVLILVFHARGKETWWVPTAGLAVVVITTIATTVVINGATSV
ncbi:MAG: hypothetical protein P0Y60_02420 [Candidatus Microbacterium colombiense]|nr:MAG: hypothetical protein P0Y60_02420 [Microbacterium sp.]